MDKSIILPAFLIVFMSMPGIFASADQAGSASSWRAEVGLLSFGAHPNDPKFNCRPSFQQAFAKLSRQGGGTLSIPAGDYYVDFPDVASDVDPRDPNNKALLQSNNLKKEKLILVPESVMVRGALDSSGNPATRIHWSATGFPLLSFVSSDNAGAENLVFVFDGVQPQFFPWSQEDFLQAVGYKSRWLGGPYEISTVIYTIGSGNLRFTNLAFQSGKTPADNAHTFGFGIVSNGKGPVTQPDPGDFKSFSIGTRVPGGGLSECVTGNTFRSLRFRDFVMGILAIGQCSPVFENIEGHNRGSWYRSFDPSHESGSLIKNIGPPGHLIYLSFQDAYDVERTQDAPNGHQVFHGTTRNKDVTLRNITEGSETLSNVNSLGTLALKDMEGGKVSNVVSKHPSGLIQTMIDAHDVQLEDLSWSSDRDICAERQDPSYCGVPVIALEPGPDNPGMQFSSGVKFKSIKLQSPRCARVFNISEESGHMPLSRDITVDGLTMTCSPVFAPGQGSPRAIITLRSADTHLTNVRYFPQIQADTPADRQNYPAVIQARSTNTSVEITVTGGEGAGNGAAASKCVIEERHNPSTGSETDNKCVIMGH